MSIGFFTKIFPGFLKSFSSRNKNARICVHLFLFVVFGGGTFTNQSLPGDNFQIYIWHCWSKKASWQGNLLQMFYFDFSLTSNELSSNALLEVVYCMTVEMGMG